MQSYPQHTSINMQPYNKNGAAATATSFSQAEPITIPVPVQQPKDFVLWSLFNFVFCNACCLGFCALAYSIKSRDRIVARDLVGAHTYGKKAKVLNIVTLFVGILVTIASIVLVIYCLPLIYWVP